MPRLLQTIKVAIEDRAFQILVDTSGGAFVFELLLSLGVEQRQILPFDANLRVCADLLLVPAALPCGHAPANPVTALRAALGAVLGEGPQGLPPGLPQGLPLVVVLERLGTRRVADHAALVAALTEALAGSHHVASAQTAGMSVAEQAALFSRAAVLVAPHGSGLSNAIFMPKGAVVVELLPWHYPNLTFYVALAGLPLRHLFYLVRGAGAYTSMDVDAQDVARRLRAWLALSENGPSVLSRRDHPGAIEL
jgi:hypothetical protein